MAKIKQPPIDWLKAVILERMQIHGYNQGDVAVLAGIGINTFNDLMKQPVPTWRYEYRKSVLIALGIKVAELPTEVQLQIAQY